MKHDVKKYLKVGFILALITSVCGVMIAGLNLITSPIIEKNAYQKEQDTLQIIFEDASFITLESTSADTNIEKVYVAQKNDETIGYVYVVSGKNAYGKIQLILGINTNGVVTDVQITENTQSFGKIVSAFVDTRITEAEITSETIDSVDVKCGATYGAKLVQSLIDSALNHYKGGISNE